MQIEHDGTWIKRISALSKRYFTPTFVGAEYIQSAQPVMYVGNHTLYGMLDAPMLIDFLYHQHKVAVVSIADHGHFYIPLWRDIYKKFGAIDGTRDYVREAMQAGYSILVFPGGGREVLKRQGEQYQLIWKQRYGFLRLAQEFHYDIVPFAALGGDEAFDIGFDANRIVQQKWFKTLLKHPKLDQWLRHGDIIPSLPKNILPKRLRFYFKFMPPLATTSIQSEQDFIDFREHIQASIYQGLNELRQQRETE